MKKQVFLVLTYFFLFSFCSHVDGVTLEPLPKNLYLPVVISNTTGLPASQVYVCLAGQQTPTSLQYFFKLGKGGVMSPVAATSKTFSVDYSYKLSALPKSATGSNDYLIYAPALNGARFYFSINSPIYLQSDTLSATSNQIVAPTYFAFYDPNYSNIFESVEVTFKPKGGTAKKDICWTATVNTTEVDAFGFPVKISYYSYDPLDPTTVTPLVQNPNALPSGFGVGGAIGSQTRDEILTAVVAGLTADDETGAIPLVWPRLALPFYTDPYAGTGLQTYLRVLSPKQSLGNAAAPSQVGGLTAEHITAVNGSGATQFKNYNYPPFPADYLTGTDYGSGGGESFATQLFSEYGDVAQLYISTGGGSPTVYEGVSSGISPNLVLTFTGVSGTNTGSVSTLNQSDFNTFKMYSGSQLMSGGPDADDLGFYFGDAFTVGFLPSIIGTDPDVPINITDAISWQPTYISQYYDTDISTVSGGPWMSLYAKYFHSVAVRSIVTNPSYLSGIGLCYAYDFDDSLGISGSITPSVLTLNSLHPYVGITLGVIDTDLPDPYSDSTSYTVTFVFSPAGAHQPPTSLEYKQGDGNWTTVTSGQAVPGLVSSRTNPLRIRYKNNQGASSGHEFYVFLYYQFFQPIGSYNSSELNIINSSTITPNSDSPSSFIITLLP